MSWLLSPAAGTISLGALQDVTITSPVNGQVLTYLNGVWINQVITAAVGISGSPLDNQIAVWTSATEIEGNANLSWDGVQLEITRATAGYCLVLHPNGTTANGIRLETTIGGPYNVFKANDTTGGNGFKLIFDPSLQANDHRLDFVSDHSGELLQLEADGVIRFLGFATDPIVMESVSGVKRMYIQNGCTLYLEHINAAQGNKSNMGQLWVQTTTPQRLNFTNEAGVTTILTGNDYSDPPTSTDAALNDVSNAINTDAGKIQGSWVYNTTTDNPVYAVGNADADIWVDGAGTTVNSPV